MPDVEAAVGVDITLNALCYRSEEEVRISIFHFL
jgi:hypothetical protein